ncbi:phosphoglycerate mutase family protein [Actinokineospora guangxiensis]|uniref:Phosphoglycerate mutase family protein n=1 Tax=Actinokineospora guangxiensis TaxID=1490288 RepID=A0ABW0EQB0_9PSEU
MRERHRGPLPHRRATAARTSGEIVLVRHADSVPPVPGGPGDLPRPLSAVGVLVAAAPVGQIAAPDAVFSSPYRRAVRTVEPIAAAAGVPAQTRWGLRERDSGVAPTLDCAASLAGLGVAVDRPFSRDMPMPAVYRVRLGETPTVSGL